MLSHFRCRAGFAIVAIALWSSIPDDALLDLAIRNKLHEPALLEQQVSRMFADPRARTSLIQNFFEDWLQTRNVWLLNPDSTKFPWFDDNLRSAFVTETEMFLDAQLKEDRSILDLLTSDETFLNEQLARHYGISGVYGSHFRRVKLTDENRFGLLGKASVLAVTSYTTCTIRRPIRGKWLLENILAAPACRLLLLISRRWRRSNKMERQAVGGPGNAGDASRQCDVRLVPFTHGSALARSMENFDAVGRVARNRCGSAPLTPPACFWTVRKSMGHGNCVEGSNGEESAIRHGRHRKIADLRSGPRAARVLRCSGGASQSIAQRAADGYRWSSLVRAIVKSPPISNAVAAAQGKEEHVRNEEGHFAADSA